MNVFNQLMPKPKPKRRTKPRATIKKVKKAYELPIQTATIVPTTSDVSKKVSVAEIKRRVNETRRVLSKLFGGYTSSRNTGGYVTKNKQLVKEPVVMVTSFAAKKTFLKNKAAWIRWVRSKKKEWGQESIGIIIENDMYYV